MTANWVVLADGTQTGVKNIHKRRHRADHGALFDQLAIGIVEAKAGALLVVDPETAIDNEIGVAPHACRDKFLNS